MPGSRSAGRVQSVAVRLIYEKEIEIEQFEPEKFYKINVHGERLTVQNSILPLQV